MIKNFLGVTIDNNLSFDKHVSNVCLKTDKKLSALVTLILQKNCVISLIENPLEITKKLFISS